MAYFQGQAVSFRECVYLLFVVFVPIGHSHKAACQWCVVSQGMKHLSRGCLHFLARMRPFSTSTTRTSVPGDAKWPFSSPSWRSLAHWKRSLNHPKKVTEKCQVYALYVSFPMMCVDAFRGVYEMSRAFIQDGYPKPCFGKVNSSKLWHFGWYQS